MKNYLAVFLVVCAGAAWAKPGNAPPTVSLGTGSGSVTYGSGAGASAFTRQVSTAPGSAAQIIDNIRVGLPANAALEFQAGRLITKAALTAAVGIAVGTGVGMLAVTAAPYLWDQLKGQGVIPCEGNACTSGAVGSAVVDARSEQTPQGIYSLPLSGGCTDIRARTAAAAGAQCAQRGLGPYDLIISQGCQEAACNYYVVYYQRRALNTSSGQPYNTSVQPITHTVSYTVQLACPELQYDVVAALRGKPCASDVRVPATSADIATAVDRMPAAVLPQVVQELEPLHEIEKQPTVLQGPSTVQAPNPTVTTRPNPVAGEPPIVESKSVTHNVTYNNNTFNYTTTNETTVNNEVIKTETGPPPEEAKTDCDKYPDSIGCLKAGEPQSVELPKDTKTVSVTPQSGWGSDNAACPAPRAVNILGVPAIIDNSLICSFMSGIRFAVLGAFGIMSALVFVGGLRHKVFYRRTV